MTAAGDASRFIIAMREHFESQPKAARNDHGSIVWVNGGVTSGGDPVIIYRTGEDGPLIGKTWNLSSLGPMFSTADPTILAEVMWDNEVNDPEDGGRYLVVDWADGLVENPDQVLWRTYPPED